MINVVGIEFKNNSRIYYFNQNNIEVEISDLVIVETEKGLQLGKVMTDAKKIDINVINNYNNIIRKASKEDVYQYEKNIEDAKMALKKAEKLVRDLNLDMKFTDVNYTFDRNQLLFHFLSDNRVDFRELAKQLASIYKTRIELRQIGVRDKAKSISGMGPCGRKVCCASFLNDLDTVSISMAKNQNLSLNPSKINGLCGRLLCCLNYENDLYSENRNGMPEVGEEIEIENKKAIVTSIDILNRKYTINVENEGKREIELEDNCEECGKCFK